MMHTIEDVKKYLRENFEDGVNCPCCGQNVKLYKRKLTGSMCVALIEIYKFDKSMATGGFFHVEMVLKKNQSLPAAIRGDFPKLRYWGLISKQEGEREDGSNRTGYYRLTETGKLFVQGVIRVPSHAKVYNNIFKGLIGDDVGIKECLKKSFNYEELMKGE